MQESVNVALQEAIDEYIGDSFFSFCPRLDPH